MAEAKKTTTKAAVKKTTAAPKKVAAKAVAKKAASKTEKVEAAVKVAEKKQTGLILDVLDTAGKVAGQVTLPAEVFGAKINKKLIAQAVRVYLVNQRRGTASTKSRGEVDGSTRKIYRQKGTGRARHGGIRAPIFVKGGIAHGPKPKDYSLSMPKKMKQAAFTSAMSAKLQDGKVIVVSGLEKLEMKTKKFSEVFKNLGFVEKRNLVVVMPKDSKDTYKGMRNLEGVVVTTVDRLSTYDVLKYNTVVLMRDAVDVFAKAHENQVKNQSSKVKNGGQKVK